MDVFFYDFGQGLAVEAAAKQWCQTVVFAENKSHVNSKN